MKKIALGFCSNSFYAGANTTIPDTDNPTNEEGERAGSRWNLRHTFSSFDWPGIRHSKKLNFPIEGEIINETEFHFPGDGGWWHTCHFAFK